MRDDLRTSLVEDPAGVGADARETDAFLIGSRRAGHGEHDYQCRGDSCELRVFP